MVKRHINFFSLRGMENSLRFILKSTEYTQKNSTHGQTDEKTVNEVILKEFRFSVRTEP